MHYPFNAFSKNGQPTLRALRPLNGETPYKALSALDAEQTNKMYGCAAKKRKRRQTGKLSLLLLLLFFFICNFGSQKRKTEAFQFSWFILTSLCLMIVQTSSVRLRNERTNS